MSFRFTPEQVKEIFQNSRAKKPRALVIPPGTELMVPDLDYMPCLPKRQPWQLFPTRPREYKKAVAVLSKMQRCSRTGKAFSALYAELPTWAQWRERYNVMACVRPGMRFQKRAPRRKKS
jgi:hypothetical protein